MDRNVANKEGFNGFCIVAKNGYNLICEHMLLLLLRTLIPYAEVKGSNEIASLLSKAAYPYWHSIGLYAGSAAVVLLWVVTYAVQAISNESN